MKTIFRYANVGLLTAVLFTVGAVTGFAQDVCGDAEAEARNAAGDKVRQDFGAYGAASLDDKGRIIDGAKAFVEKYGSCETTKELTEYLNKYIPGMETALRKAREDDRKAKLYKRFNDSVKASNFDETYAVGKEILAGEPEQLDVTILLGSIGYDESYKANFKFNNETLRYARQAIAAIEAGKTSKEFGLFGWRYKNKENALGWLNLTIGYITQVANKDKKGALPHLYKASQAVSETAKNPIPYELVGGYYFDQLNALVEEINALKAKQDKPGITEEEIKQLLDEIKAKVAMTNGTAERAIDAFGRAEKLGQAAAYKAKMKANVEAAYKVRFGNTTGMDQWVATAVAKPFVNPQTPITPISDPEPATTTTTPATTTTTMTSSPAGTKPVVSPAAKPAVTPATKSTTVTKPQATVKKPVAKTKRKA